MSISNILPEAFDQSQYDLPNSGTYIKESGDVVVYVKDAKLRAARENNANMYIEVQLGIVGGNNDGMTTVDRVNLYNVNAVASDLGRKQLKAYCVALGIHAAFNDLTVLKNGRRFMVHVTASEVVSKKDSNKKVWENRISNIRYENGDDLVAAGASNQQQQPQQSYASPAAPSAPAPQAPNVPSAPAQQQQQQQQQQQAQYAPPQAPQTHAPAPQQPQYAAPAAPSAQQAQPQYAAPTGQAPSFAAP